MYQVNLTQSHFPLRDDVPLLPTTVGSVLREAAARWPDRTALISADGPTADRQWTYAELLAESEELAGALLTRFSPGERVAIWAPNAPEWVLLEFALALAGLTLVTVNPGYQARELAYVLRQSNAAGLMLVRNHRGNPMEAIAAEVVRDLPGLREVTDIEDPAALYRKAGPVPPLPEVQPHDPAQIQYTSGTTGNPKGVVLHHLGLTNNARIFNLKAGLPPGSVNINAMPLFHTAGCAIAVLGAVQHGSTLVLLRQFDPASMLDLAQSQQVFYLLGVPTMLIAVLEEHKARPRALSSLGLVGSGGSMVPPELVRAVTDEFGCRFLTVYGQTEASPLLTVVGPDDAFDDICHTVGQPLVQTEMAIMATDGSGPVAIGQVGEICARAYAVMLGYNDNPEATAAAIDAEGWLHTGDLGTMDSRGFVRVTGRVKDMIIRGGENLFPAEIENVLLEHPDVAEVAVVGVPDDRLGEAVAAFVRVREGASFDPDALKAHCRAQIAAQKAPSHWIAVREWPLTGSGKIQKFALRDQWIAAGGADGSVA
ncbi:MAG: AMP-binding protein [Novosphingobium sp.]|uniref:AMP-binding protein n=1 Tax=Novosphingobium sp. TaxID=1874826 RepID=UPI0022C8B461|nr:AMP-binding protein [Novosphingobium sp.]MCZ8033604.1 AMP-binding protein [Novosphingobium sp.]